MLFAEPIWASGHVAAYIGRTHDRFRTTIKSRKFLLELNGPSTHGFPVHEWLLDRAEETLRSTMEVGQNSVAKPPGVVIDQDGRPICTEMWPGNTADVTVLVPMVDCLRSRFGIGQQVGGQIRSGLVLSNPNSVLRAFSC